MAVGITAFAHMPATLAALPGTLASHSFDHRTVDQFKGKDTVVVGAGASAVNLAYELLEAGAAVTLLARGPCISYHSLPNPKALSPFELLTNPPAPFGQGWKSLLVARLPQIFYRLPRPLRARAIRSHMHPAAGWFMRDKVMGLVPEILGQPITRAWEDGGKAHIALGNGREVVCDHVFAGTGYRMDLNRLGFLSARVRQAIARTGCTLNVSAGFETDLEGLYALGPLAMENFGPLLRFVCGTSFAAPRLARVLKRRVLLKRIEARLRDAVHGVTRKLQDALA
jgi:hypothetical protein